MMPIFFQKARSALACFLLAGVLLAIPPAVMADSATSSEPVRIGNPVSRSLQGLLGLNWLSARIAERVARRELRRNKITGDLQVRIKPFSALDLAAGNVRSVEISGRPVLYDDALPVTEFSFKTDPETPVFIRERLTKKGKRRHMLVCPVRATLEISVKEEDFNRMLQSPAGIRRRTDVKLKLPAVGEQRLDFLDSRLRLVEERLVLDTLVNVHQAPRESALPVTVVTRILPDDSGKRLKLSDLALYAEDVEDLSGVADFIEDYLAKIADFSKWKFLGQPVGVKITESAVRGDRWRLKAAVTFAPESGKI